MNIGDRVRLSDQGRMTTHIFPDLEVRGVVVRPGLSRGRLYLRVLIDEAKEPRTFARSYWEKDDGIP